MGVSLRVKINAVASKLRRRGNNQASRHNITGRLRSARPNPNRNDEAPPPRPPRLGRVGLDPPRPRRRPRPLQGPAPQRRRRQSVDARLLPPLREVRHLHRLLRRLLRRQSGQPEPESGELQRHVRAAAGALQAVPLGRVRERLQRRRRLCGGHERLRCGVLGIPGGGEGGGVRVREGELRLRERQRRRDVRAAVLQVRRPLQPVRRGGPAAEQRQQRPEPGRGVRPPGGHGVPAPRRRPGGRPVLQLPKRRRQQQPGAAVQLPGPERQLQLQPAAGTGGRILRRPLLRPQRQVHPPRRLPRRDVLLCRALGHVREVQLRPQPPVREHEHRDQRVHLVHAARRGEQRCQRREQQQRQQQQQPGAGTARDPRVLRPTLRGRRQVRDGHDRLRDVPHHSRLLVHRRPQPVGEGADFRIDLECRARGHGQCHAPDFGGGVCRHDGDSGGRGVLHAQEGAAQYGRAGRLRDRHGVKERERG